ncbi:MAG: glycosyltransferase family 39 protein [Anaerolineae bacterium]
MFAIRNSQFVILACFIALASAYGLVVPPFENLDEVEHFGVVRYIADHGRLPVHGSPAEEIYHYRQEASQPPLYHLLSAGLVRLLGLQAGDAASFWHFNPRVVCGPEEAGLYDNRAIFYRDPNRESFPWHGTLLTLHVLRTWSTLLQTITVLGTYGLARLAFPRRRAISLVAMSIVAFNPQFLLVASGVNNDNLVIPLVTAGLYLLLRIWRDGLSAWRTAGLGLLVGLAGLTKLSGWLLLPLSAIVILIRAHRPPTSTRNTRRPELVEGQHATRNTPHAIAHCPLLIAPALAISAWWFWRNWQLYGDPTALQPMLELVGTREGASIQPFLEAGWMFRSFWGQIPCSFYPPAFYAFYAVLTLLALGGLAWGWQRLTSGERVAAAILAGWFLLVVAGWARWDVMTPAPGGRLLFPALPAVALLMALGIEELARHRPGFGGWIVVALFALMACWTVTRILPGFFAPPARYADASAVHPANPLDATLGDAIQLLGYDAAIDSKGPTLDVTLYWQTLASMDEDYVLALQLVSPVPGDTTLRWNYNSWPGHGNYPTSAWQPGEVIADRYRFRLPEAEFPTQAWDLHLILYRMETGERLPVRLNEAAAGNRLVLARLRVPGRPPSCPDDGLLASEVRFGEVVALTHAAVIPDQEETRVVLCWKSLQPLPADYTVFVHLQDATGALVSTGDGPPMQGAFPTSMWRPGDVILDVHRLTLAAGDVEAGRRITVGLYDLEDGSRLPAYIEEVPVPDAAVSVWPDHP